MVDRVTKTDEEWRAELTPDQYAVCRGKGTERPFTGVYNDCKKNGTYACVACGAPVFKSVHKFDSGSGWPSFYSPYADDSVKVEEDLSYGMRRIEVMCAACDSHLGHVFPDGPQPTGMRYCINSISLKLEEEA